MLSIFPKSKAGERAHREDIRRLEIEVTVEEISRLLKDNPDFAGRELQILEFGCGDGFQVPYLKPLGKVTATDIYYSLGMKALPEVKFLLCDSIRSPFKDGQFDLIFSNHVIEHIDEVEAALRETQRIGKPGCLYAFSVPTSTWLLISVPSQYFSKVRKFFRILIKLLYKLLGRKTPEWTEEFLRPDQIKKPRKGLLSRLRVLLPGGHGSYPKFLDCYRKFKIKRWRQFLIENGFEIIAAKPVLLYGPSEWPIISTRKCETDFCSSVLFLMRKKSG